MHHIGLYGSAKSVCLGKIWFSSYIQKSSWPIRLQDFLKFIDYVPLNYKEVLLKEIAMRLRFLFTVSYFAPWNAWKRIKKNKKLDKIEEK